MFEKVLNTLLYNISRVLNKFEKAPVFLLALIKILAFLLNFFIRNLTWLGVK